MSKTRTIRRQILGRSRRQPGPRRVRRRRDSDRGRHDPDALAQLVDRSSSSWTAPPRARACSGVSSRARSAASSCSASTSRRSRPHHGDFEAAGRSRRWRPATAVHHGRPGGRDGPADPVGRPDAERAADGDRQQRRPRPPTGILERGRCASSISVTWRRSPAWPTRPPRSCTCRRGRSGSSLRSSAGSRWRSRMGPAPRLSCRCSSTSRASVGRPPIPTGTRSSSSRRAPR